MKLFTVRTLAAALAALPEDQQDLPVIFAQGYTCQGEPDTVAFSRVYPSTVIPSTTLGPIGSELVSQAVIALGDIGMDADGLLRYLGRLV